MYKLLIPANSTMDMNLENEWDDGQFNWLVYMSGIIGDKGRIDHEHAASGTVILFNREEDRTLFILRWL